ncbi:malto-oligosyltrehalose synthase [Xenophilus arseniciresistens]|uniref:4-alpha-glucanotransferase n=1 Tax=Xenophilus arseniciresistens TaxID=1283306 RepID=A0AAE3N5C2_9BURK|nr:malto-oligosyltrehalose synthase [Xenophilus arseniciresistens]MDA7415173.1 malto-oligosyltrehalose synthase [Xenophilus arseniciresistens]
MHEALHRACERLGIATFHHDVWGHRVDVAPQSLAALLAHFGMGAHAPDDEAAWQAEVQALDTRRWRRALPPVVLAAADAQVWQLPLNLLLPLPSSLRWTLTDEAGHRTQGQATVPPTQADPQARQLGLDCALVNLQMDGPALPMGYHQLQIEGLPGQTLVVAAPPRCHLPEDRAESPAAEVPRQWGISAQLYALRSERQWGMGDFSDLAELASMAARLGAQAIGLNPLHALFPDDATKCSPYSPSSRLHLNALYIDVEAIPAYQRSSAARQRVASAAFQARLAALSAAPLVVPAEVAAAKLEVLQLVHEEWRRGSDAESTDQDEHAQFDAFVRMRGQPLQRQALFDALQTHFRALDPQAWGWPQWPQALHNPEGEAAQQFAREHASRVEFFAWLQWVADTQLQAAAQRCRAEGMAIGLYLDQAVSVDRYGADAWGAGDVLATAVSVGAPPDAFNPLGQDWGLPPLRPDRLRETGYQLFIDTLRASMRGAGALRIDHVMGLVRLYCMPPGASAADGAYVHYDAQQMLAIVALESQRHQCLVIGEDLGTVADETRALLQRFGLLSYRLAYFEREADAFKPATQYPREALVSVSTHDLATLQGWWGVADLRERMRLQLYPDEAIARQQLADRAQERAQLLFALQDAGLLDADQVARNLAAQTLSTEASAAVHAWLARAPSRLLMVQAEDLLGVVEQANLPGTIDTHPNWRRRLPLATAQWQSDPQVRAITAAIARERPAPRLQGHKGGALIPRATYRLQFHKDFGFDDAIRILPYLARLGISHVYCSPIQRARPGSMHGYDVVAHGEINPELGGFEGFARFTQALRQLGMGQLLDLVPNHMGVLGADNPWWTDVLENGQDSPWARCFDIDWQALDPALTGKVLIPVLGDAYGRVLDDGQLELALDAGTGRLAVHYHAHRFPLAPASYGQVLRWAAALTEQRELQAEMESIGHALAHLPGREDGAARLREAQGAFRRLAALAAQSAAAAPLAEALRAWNRPQSRDALHALLDQQHYRLAFWRVASDEINYRRFFDINELAALRVEDPEVFEATQGLALDLAARGWVDGLRIDHPDGLRDPAAYFRALQQGYARRAGLPSAPGAPWPLYVVCEKIAAGHEEVPPDWAVHGTTGYRFANVANGVLIDTAAEPAFARIWQSFTGVREPYESLVLQAKRSVAQNALASDLTVLCAMLLRLARTHRSTRDYTLGNLRRALADVAAHMSVYRTYVAHGALTAQDERFITQAVQAAREASELADDTVFDFIHQAMRGRSAGEGEEARQLAERFAARFQQFSAPVAAKGVEDTAFYRHFPLLALNEVGGEPAQFGFSLAQFHTASQERARDWPHTMLATSTHDNKRSEDVRTRIDVLSEMPAAWRLALRRWRAFNAPLREEVQARFGGKAPSRADEYLLYQTLIGTWGTDPDAQGYVARIDAYMRKAAREAKRHTSWLLPQQAYEDALAHWVRACLDRQRSAAFLEDLDRLAATVAWCGGLNSLVLVTLKYTSAGVPDLYQGNELLDFSLVDPDNRRPVDYEARARRLEALTQQPPFSGAGHDALSPARLDDAKLWLTHQLLALRSRAWPVLRDGGHAPLALQGPAAQACIAFERSTPQGRIVTVCARFFARQGGQSQSPWAQADGASAAPQWDASPWRDTQLQLPAAGAWRDALTGRVHEGAGPHTLEALLATLPCAVLELQAG